MAATVVAAAVLVTSWELAVVGATAEAEGPQYWLPVYSDMVVTADTAAVPVLTWSAGIVGVPVAEMIVVSSSVSVAGAGMKVGSDVVSSSLVTGEETAPVAARDAALEDALCRVMNPVLLQPPELVTKSLPVG